MRTTIEEQRNGTIDGSHSILKEANTGKSGEWRSVSKQTKTNNELTKKEETDLR